VQSQQPPVSCRAWLQPGQGTGWRPRKRDAHAKNKPVGPRARRQDAAIMGNRAATARASAIASSPNSMSFRIPGSWSKSRVSGQKIFGFWAKSQTDFPVMEALAAARDAAVAALDAALSTLQAQLLAQYRSTLADIHSAYNAGAAALSLAGPPATGPGGDLHPAAPGSRSHPPVLLEVDPRPALFPLDRVVGGPDALGGGGSPAEPPLAATALTGSGGPGPRPTVTPTTDGPRTLAHWQVVATCSVWVARVPGAD
jgi:hypothetical protein